MTPPQKITIYNEDNIRTMARLGDGSVDTIITSPPYNTNSVYYTGGESAYDEYMDNKTTEEYVGWIAGIFREFSRILKRDGVVLWNCSYGNGSADCMLSSLAGIVSRTPFSCFDIFSWVKPSAIPNSVSPNRTTRIAEYWFVFARKSESQTYFMSKPVTSVRDTGQRNFGNITNVIHASNNDSSCPINRCAFSTEVVSHLLKLYCPKGGVVYDPFIGTGTTANASSNLGLECIGSEISLRQCKYAKERIDDMFRQVVIVENGDIEKTSESPLQVK